MQASLPVMGLLHAVRQWSLALMCARDFDTCYDWHRWVVNWVVLMALQCVYTVRARYVYRKTLQRGAADSRADCVSDSKVKEVGGGSSGGAAGNSGESCGTTEKAGCRHQAATNSDPDNDKTVDAVTSRHTAVQRATPSGSPSQSALTSISGPGQLQAVFAMRPVGGGHARVEAGAPGREDTSLARRAPPPYVSMSRRACSKVRSHGRMCDLFLLHG